MAGQYGFVSLSDDALVAELVAVESDSTQLLGGIALRTCAARMLAGAPADIVELAVMGADDPQSHVFRALDSLARGNAIDSLTGDQTYYLHDMTHGYAGYIIEMTAVFGAPSLDDFNESDRLDLRAIIAVHNAVAVPFGGGHIDGRQFGLGWLVGDAVDQAAEFDAFLASLMDGDDSWDEQEWDDDEMPYITGYDDDDWM